MAKLTQKQRRRLEILLGQLNRGLNYLHSDRVTVARRCKVATTTLHFKREPVSADLLGVEMREAQETFGNYSLDEVSKHLGSDLVLLRTAKIALEDFLLGN